MRRLLLIGILLCLGLWVNADNNLCHTIWQGLCRTDGHWQAGYLASLGVNIAPHEIPPGAQSCITIRVRSNLRTSPVISRRTLIDTVPAGTVLHILATAHDDDGRQWYRAHWNGRQVFWAKWLPHSHACGSSGQSIPPPQQSATRSQSVARSQSATRSQSVARSQNNFSCGRRKTCGQMSSCAEARFHFTQCGNGRLDGDNDGIPCEAICG